MTDVNTLRAVAQARQLAELQRRDLNYFVWAAFEELQSARSESFERNWHILAITWQLLCMVNGDSRRLLVTMPPRHLKTITITVAFVAWLLGNNPSLKIICITYANILSRKNFEDLKRLLESAWYRRLFPEARFAFVGNQITTPQGGSVMVSSVEGSITGFGADYIIGDDLMKAADVAYPAMRQTAKDFYQHSMVSRLDNKQVGRIIVVGQRLHEDDVPAHLLEMGTFRHLNLPAIAEEAEQIQIGPKLFHARKKNDILFPQREPLHILEEIRQEQGPRYFNAQYQQRPGAEGNNGFNWSWWKTYEERPARNELWLVVQSWDFGMSSNINSDFSACTTWGYREGEWYLLDVWRGRLDYNDLKAKVIDHRKRWAADRILIERAGLAYTMFTEFIREERLIQYVEEYKPKVSKELRFDTQIGRVQNGSFYLPADAPWLSDFRKEFQAFPNGRHDDMVDTTTQFLHYLGYRAGLGMVRRKDEEIAYKRRRESEYR